MTVTFPDFVDLQVNSFAGVDFNSPEVTPAHLDRAVAAIVARVDI